MKGEPRSLFEPVVKDITVTQMPDRLLRMKSTPVVEEPSDGQGKMSSRKRQWAMTSDVFGDVMTNRDRSGESGHLQFSTS